MKIKTVQPCTINYYFWTPRPHSVCQYHIITHVINFVKTCHNSVLGRDGCLCFLPINIYLCSINELINTLHALGLCNEYRSQCLLAAKCSSQIINLEIHFPVIIITIFCSTLVKSDLWQWHAMGVFSLEVIYHFCEICEKCHQCTMMIAEHCRFCWFM